MKFSYTLFALATATLVAGCATESHQSIQTERAQQSVTINRSTSGKQVSVSIGQFANHSAFQNGIFSDGVDRLGTQAQTILMSFLQQAGCYQVLDRSNMQALQQESKYRNSKQNIIGARYVVTGDVVEFGRKTTGDHQLWGILGHGKAQIAYAKVNLNIVDTRTSAVAYTATGAGEYELSSRDVLGFGGSAGYDSTLNGKVLSLAIREAVNELTAAIDNGLWSPR